MKKSNSGSYGLLILAALSLVFIFGTAAGTTRASGAGKQASSRSSASSNAYIMKEVHHELVMLPFLSVFDNLEYRVDGGTVTLMGQVVNSALKDDAASAVKHIEGVESVDNQIQVLPTSPMDEQIRRAEYRAIYSAPNLQMYAIQSVAPIHIIVSNGNVTLEGVVATQADKDAANVVANGVPNVFSVMNNLQVEKQ